MERTFKNKGKKWDCRFPLVEWNMTEKQALELCQIYGYDWGNLYKYLDRVSCKYCRNKNLKELENIYRFMPDVWQGLKEIEKKHGNYRKYSLEELENRINNKE